MSRLVTVLFWSLEAGKIINVMGGYTVLPTVAYSVAVFVFFQYDLEKIRNELTNREFMLLKILMENKNIVLTRDVLMEKVCGYDYVGETNVIDVYIRYLRTKIDDKFNVKIITTVRGVGYVIKDE